MPHSYLTIFLDSVISKEPIAALSLFFLFVGRFFPIIALSPFFGSRVLPHPVKVMLALTLFIIFLPKLVANTTTPIQFNFLLVLFLIKEVFVGIILGTIVSLPFIIAQSAGIIIDHQRGGASLMINDPTIQNQSSPIGTMLNMVLIYVFFMIGGPWDFLDAVLISYDMVPPDQFINPYFFREDTPSWEMVLTLFGQVMIMTTQLATPALIAILMTDSFLGLANRLAPQVQITFLGLPLKSLLGLSMLCFGWRLLVKQMIFDARYWLHKVGEMSSYFGISTT